ncbi:MAG: ABC transporter ATP-binding protein, partial [Lachnospiraceae bacterium]|nr:ABC transporter ATP-binding protein [Lachnospiraceae bacterium]
MNDQDQAKTKQSIKQVFSNNLFLLKLIFNASPSLVLYQAIDSMRNQVSIFVEHTLLIGYVLEAAEFGYPFKKVAAIILIIAG